MNLEDILQVASGNNKQVQEDWMPATQVRPIIFEDPALIWLEHHGGKYGFQPDESPYDFLKFIGEKGRQFQDKYENEVTPGAPRVCKQPYEVRSADMLRETLSLMDKGVPVISQAALWWAPDRVYGAPDFLIHTSWLKEGFPGLLDQQEAEKPAPNLGGNGRPGHYIVFDAKFTTKLEETSKAVDFENYKAQLRIYSFILGKLQGLMPRKAFLTTRDHLFEPISISIRSQLDAALDKDLEVLRDLFLDIKINGEKYVPWKDKIVASKLSNEDERWSTAKKKIALDKVPGRDPELVYQISSNVKQELAALGFPNLDSMLKVDAANVPIDNCRGIGAKKAKQIRAVLNSNRLGKAILPAKSLVPKAKEFEFYVDFEYFTNVNVDFDAQWPTLEGHEMIFMVGIGWEEGGEWVFDALVSRMENQTEERQMLETFLEFLRKKTNGTFWDNAKTALYHWTGAEVWQARRTSDRQNFPPDHPLRSLAWCDLQKVFLEGPGAVPGTWDFTLKGVTRALSKFDPRFGTEWPGELDKGLRAMVMGWRAYQNAEPLISWEMSTLKAYLDADCKALWNILKWLRNVC